MSVLYTDISSPYYTDPDGYRPAWAKGGYSKDDYMRCKLYWDSLPKYVFPEPVVIEPVVMVSYTCPTCKETTELPETSQPPFWASEEYVMNLRLLEQRFFLAMAAWYKWRRRYYDNYIWWHKYIKSVLHIRKPKPDKPVVVMGPCLFEPEFWEPVGFEIVDTFYHVVWRLSHHIFGYDSSQEQFMYNTFMTHKKPA